MVFNRLAGETNYIRPEVLIRARNFFQDAKSIGIDHLPLSFRTGKTGKTVDFVIKRLREEEGKADIFGQIAKTNEAGRLATRLEGFFRD